ASLFLFVMRLLRPTSPLFPYTTLFRSQSQVIIRHQPPPFGIATQRARVWHPQAEVVDAVAVDVGHHGAIEPTGGTEGQLGIGLRSEEHTSELQSRENLVCRLLLEKKKK